MKLIVVQTLTVAHTYRIQKAFHQIAGLMNSFKPIKLI